MSENLYKSSLSLKLHNRPNLLNSRSIHSPNGSSRAANIVYIFLKGQETVLCSIYEKLANSSSEAKHHDEICSSLQCLLSSNYSSFFQNLNNLITTMQNILSFQDIPPDIERIAQQLLTTSFSMNSMLNNFDMKKTSENTANNHIMQSSHIAKSTITQPQSHSPPPSASIASRPPPIPHKQLAHFASKSNTKTELPLILVGNNNDCQETNSSESKINSYPGTPKTISPLMVTGSDKNGPPSSENGFLGDKQHNFGLNINKDNINATSFENNKDLNSSSINKCVNDINNNNTAVGNKNFNETLFLSDDSFDDDEYDDMSNVVCRICDEKIPVDKFDEHTKLCADLYRSATFVNEVNEKLKTMLEEIKKKYLDEKWPGRLNSAVNVFIPVLTATIMIENVIAIDLSDPDAADELKAFSQLFIFYSKSPRQIEYDLQHIFKPLIDAKLKAANAIVQSNIQLDFVKKFTVKQPLISDFDLVKRISSGAFARVFLAKKKSTQDIYAIKVTPKSSLTQKNQVKRILAEKDILLQFSNPHIVSFFYSIIGKNNLYLIMEFLPGGDLYSLLQNIGSMDESTAKTYSLQIIHALKYLREKGIIHRDLKPDNILIAKNGFLKLTDFGLSFMGIINRNKSSTTSSSVDLGNSDADLGNSDIDSNLVQSNSLVGTPDYIAPEILLNRPHSFAADLWSLGVMIYEFVCGEPPFHGKTEKETHEKIIRGRYTIDSDLDLSDEIVDLLAKLLKPNPAERIGATNINELIEHPWFEDADVNSVPFTPDLKSKEDTNYFECRYDLTNADDRDILEDMTTNYSNTGNNNGNIQAIKITGYNSNSALTKNFNSNIKSLPPKIFMDSLLSTGNHFYNNSNNSSFGVNINYNDDNNNKNIINQNNNQQINNQNNNQQINNQQINNQQINNQQNNNQQINNQQNNNQNNIDYDGDSSENGSFQSSMEKLPKYDQNQIENDHQKLPQIFTSLPPPPPTRPNLSPPNRSPCTSDSPFSSPSDYNNSDANISSSSSYSSSSSVNPILPSPNSSHLSSLSPTNSSANGSNRDKTVSKFPLYYQSNDKYDTYDTYDSYDKYDNKHNYNDQNGNDSFHNNYSSNNYSSNNTNSNTNSNTNNITNDNVTNSNTNNSNRQNSGFSRPAKIYFPPISNKKPSFPNSVKMPTMSNMSSIPSTTTTTGNEAKLICANFSTSESEKLAQINSATLEVKFESVSIQSLVTTNQRMAEKARRRRSLSFDIAKGDEVPRRNSADDSKKFFQLIHSNANEETPSMLCDSQTNAPSAPNANGFCKH